MRFCGYLAFYLCLFDFDRPLLSLYNLYKTIVVCVMRILLLSSFALLIVLCIIFVSQVDCYFLSAVYAMQSVQSVCVTSAMRSVQSV